MTDSQKSRLTTHLISGCWLALPLRHRLALGHPLSDALLGLPLLVLGVPHGDVLGPALHPMLPFLDS